MNRRNMVKNGMGITLFVIGVMCLAMAILTMGIAILARGYLVDRVAVVLFVSLSAGLVSLKLGFVLATTKKAAKKER